LNLAPDNKLWKACVWKW